MAITYNPTPFFTLAKQGSTPLACQISLTFESQAGKYALSARQTYWNEYIIVVKGSTAVIQMSSSWKDGPKQQVCSLPVGYVSVSNNSRTTGNLFEPQAPSGLRQD